LQKMNFSLPGDDGRKREKAGDSPGISQGTGGRQRESPPLGGLPVSRLPVYPGLEKDKSKSKIKSNPDMPK